MSLWLDQVVGVDGSADQVFPILSVIKISWDATRNLFLLDQALWIYGPPVELGDVHRFDILCLQPIDNFGLLSHQIGLVVRLEAIPIILGVVLPIVEGA